KAREGVARGGYVLREGSGGPNDIDLLFIATGSELHLAMGAAEKLEADGVKTRVVSLPCWELFDAQDDGYRASVLPPAATRRVAVEAGATLGWERWVGSAGAIVGLDHYGASAPGATIFEHFGFTLERVTEVGRRVVHDGVHGRIPTLEGGHLPAIGPDGSRRSRRSGHPHLRKRRGCLDCGQQDPWRALRCLPRHVLRASGRRARRHEHPHARFAGHRAGARDRMRDRVPGCPVHRRDAPRAPPAEGAGDRGPRRVAAGTLAPPAALAFMPMLRPGHSGCRVSCTRPPTIRPARRTLRRESPTMGRSDRSTRPPRPADEASSMSDPATAAGAAVKFSFGSDEASAAFESAVG